MVNYTKNYLQKIKEKINIIKNQNIKYKYNQTIKQTLSLIALNQLRNKNILNFHSAHLIKYYRERRTYLHGFTLS